MNDYNKKLDIVAEYLRSQPIEVIGTKILRVFGMPFVTNNGMYIINHQVMNETNARTYIRDFFGRLNPDDIIEIYTKIGV